MLEILTRNYNYRNKTAKLYEIGRIYLAGGEDGLANEAKLLSIGAYGSDMDFFAMKGVVSAVLDSIRAEKLRFEAVSDNPSYHPGRCAAVWSGETCVGVFGQIHPLVAQNYGVDGELYCAELSFDALMAVKGADPVYKPLPKFPSVTRDLAVVCKEEITVGALEACIAKNAGKILTGIQLFDIYRGAHIAEGSKSVAFSLEFRAADRTLTDSDTEEAMGRILKGLESELSAVLR